MKAFLLPLAVALSLCTPAFGQADLTCAGLQERIKAAYDFKPSKVAPAQLRAKAAQTDAFWGFVQANPHLTSCLREALAAPGAHPWFQYDGSMLLVELDRSRSARQLQVRFWNSADLDDVDLETWLTTLATRGSEGFDVSEAGERWLKYPAAKYLIPELGLDVETATGALFIFGSMDENQATPALLKIVNDPTHPGREIALSILAAQATAESLRALQQINPDGFSARLQERLLEPREKPKISREEFLKAFQSMLNDDWKPLSELIEKVPDGEIDMVSVLKPEDLPLFRQVRRLMISKCNPHAIDYYQTFTRVLLTLTWKM